MCNKSHYFLQSKVAVREFPEDHLIENQPKRQHIGLRSGTLAQDGLRRHVQNRTQDRFIGREKRLPRTFRQTEVGNFRSASRSDQDIRRLEISMRYFPFVQVGESVSQASGENRVREGASLVGPGVDDPVPERGYAA